ncbi:Myb-like DNA-binding domain containing protein [Histomonas meleagridis]|uniref:Myb-like DNA-binding domain containing protein n=1 Tax=Histomonas meleagridis TaxID=135588 RepID=UPI003559FF83|nr:Myb-like DNA-binding domain containing protein [Histomonas meleagridis]KAH0802324.1 Myb-like DNA-binding domain containing protein [Histomonas meleagridis]
MASLQQNITNQVNITEMNQNELSNQNKEKPSNLQILSTTLGDLSRFSQGTSSPFSLKTSLEITQQKIENTPKKFTREPPKIEAAPYPRLPPSSIVLQELAQINAKLKQQREELRFLIQARQANYIVTPDFESLDPSLGIQNYQGMITPHKTINQISQANISKIQTTHQKYYLRCPKTSHRISHISHLPDLIHHVDTNSECLSPLFKTILSWKSIGNEKAHLLARQYVEHRQIWENEIKALDEYHREKRELLPQWPKEIANMPTKPKDRSSYISCVAPDQPMYLEDSEFYSFEFFTMNGFVPDPLAAHIEFKKRLCWTEAETRIFLDKYRLHPKDFKKIAAGLPQKSVKDVIEYYFTHRIELDLKKLENQSKKKERKRGNSAVMKK